MAYRVRITESADRDLEEIIAYIAIKLANPKAATDFVTALEERYTTLEDHPLMYELSQNDRLSEQGYHRFVVGSYIVLYLVDEEQQVVNIARVIYGRRNYEKII